MEQEIKRTFRRVHSLFAIFWILSVLLILIGEVGNDWIGVYAGNERATYLTETFTILLTAFCIPFSLKLFAWVLVKRIDQVSLPQALRLYMRWSGVRLLLLAIPVVMGLYTYYLMLSNTGALCALIGLTASLFCLPGEERMRRELQIDKEA